MTTRFGKKRIAYANPYLVYITERSYMAVFWVCKQLVNTTGNLPNTDVPRAHYQLPGYHTTHHVFFSSLMCLIKISKTLKINFCSKHSKPFFFFFFGGCICSCYCFCLQNLYEECIQWQKCSPSRQLGKRAGRDTSYLN